MKYWLLSLLFTVCLFQVEASGLLVEEKIGLFQPSSTTLQKIYGKGWANYQFEISQPLSRKQPIWRNIYLWSSINYLKKGGRSLGGHDATTIRLLPLSAGIKLVCPLMRFLEVSLSGGARYFFLYIDNKVDFVMKKVRKQGLGGVCSAAILIHPHPHFFFTLFSDYSMKRFSFSKENPTIERYTLEVGGMTMGAGIGLTF